MKKSDFEKRFLAKTLTRRQLARQDFADNEVFDLLQKLLPAHKKLAWDIEIIGAVRDAIENEVADRGLMSRRRFYPYIEI